jgi:hypothetical protein
MPRKGYTDWKELPVCELLPAMFCTMIGKCQTRRDLWLTWEKLHLPDNRLTIEEIQALEEVLLYRAKDLDIPIKKEGY